MRLKDLLSHLYVLIPVLDAEKHYWVGEDEIEKLLRRGQGWLEKHPEREAIVNRYLRYQKRLTREALARLLREEEVDVEAVEQRKAEQEAAIETKLRLNDIRMQAVVDAITESGATSVIDLGCGEGKLLGELLKRPQFKKISGMDVSHRSLQLAAERLHLETLPALKKERIDVFQGSLIYADNRLAGYEAAAVVEVIEHLDPPRLAAFERVVFERAKPGFVVLTTPNAEYNALFGTLGAGQFRHRDHRFEWNRAEFREWASRVAERFGYTAEIRTVGAEDEQFGPPTQMGVFRK